MSRDAVAASVADVSACVVRVPCEARFAVIPWELAMSPQKVDR